MILQATSWMHRQRQGFIIVAGKERGGVVERLRNLDRVGKKGGEFSCRRDDATSSFWWRRLGLQIFRSQGNQRYDFYHLFSESSLKSGFDMCCSVLWQKLIGRFDSSYIQAHGDAPLQHISEYCSYAAPMLESNYKSRRVSFVRLLLYK